MITLPVIQGPSSYKLTGHLQKFRENPLGFLENLTEYGEIATFRVAHKRFYVTRDPQLIKDVVITNSKAFQKIKLTHMFKTLLGEEMLWTDEALYMSPIQPSQLKQHLTYNKEAIAKIIEKHTETWEEGQLRTIVKDIRQIVIAVLLQLVFGISIEEKDKIHYVQALMRKKEKLGKIYIRLPLHQPDSDEQLEQLLFERVQMRVQNKTAGNDLLQYILNSYGEDSDEREIYEQLNSIFLSMYEMITHVCSWSIHLLSQNTREHLQLHKEIQAYASGESLSTKNLTYMRKIIAESMRLYPPLWLFGRQAREDIQIDGYSIKKGEIMLISPYMMHRHEDYFLEPSEFLPDRFEKGGSIDVPSYMYMPLGIEHQAERGMDYITEIVTIFLSEMTKRFLFQLTKPESIAPMAGVMLNMKEELKVNVQKVHAQS